LIKLGMETYLSHLLECNNVFTKLCRSKRLPPNHKENETAWVKCLIYTRPWPKTEKKASDLASSVYLTRIISIINGREHGQLDTRILTDFFTSLSNWVIHWVVKVRVRYTQSAQHSWFAPGNHPVALRKNLSTIQPKHICNPIHNSSQIPFFWAQLLSIVQRRNE
jgi:hypothetical protein